MARYKHTDIENGQGLFLTINLNAQLVPGTFEHMLDELIGTRIDISAFDKNYNNDETGAKAIPPEVLIKLVIYGYSKGMKSSRKLCEFCSKNIIAKALTRGMEPHWTTIASFISGNSEIFQRTFVEVLMYCSELDLIGGNTFAIDGCRLPSNASMEVSGTKEELEKKVKILSRMAEKHIAKHKRQDERGELDERKEENYQKRQEKLKRQIEKLNDFLDGMKQKEGKRTEEIKSNVTDNESAMIRTKTGYIQGYIGLSVVDDKNQIIVSAEAVGNTNEGEYLPQLLDDTLKNMDEVGVKSPEDEKLIMMADNNYFSEDNIRACHDRNIEGIIPDRQYKKRLGGNENRRYELGDFKYHEEEDYYECPNGKKLICRKKNRMLPGKHGGEEYQANVKECRICPFNVKCINTKKEMSKIEKGKILLILRNKENGSLCNAMRMNLNSVEYQDKYAHRIGIIEPAFAFIKYCMELNLFTLRSKKKVNGQWLLYCMVHNLRKCLKGYNKEMGYT
ncbi:MAG: transposase [Leptospirales bacterium]|nr:transposase [Leptospirales bacterium]